MASARMEQLKIMYDVWFVNFVSTRKLKDYGMTKSNMYELRKDGFIEKTLGGGYKSFTRDSRLKNYNGDYVSTEDDTERNGNFWRITEQGASALIKEFEIGEDVIVYIAQHLLTAE